MKEYKLKINSNPYHVLIREVTDESVIAEVNGEEVVVEVENISNLSLPISPAGEALIPASAGQGPLAVMKDKLSEGVAPADGEVLTPIPGQVISISVSKGDKVRQGQKLLTLEAMKLENVITAAQDGTVQDVLVTEGEVVTQGQILLRVA
ncbi:MAG: biotin/lipoyl-containing protein [Thermodesulfobacteriota bacterium]